MEKGFFITEASAVPFDYTPIGSFVLSEHSGTVNETIKVLTKDGTRLYEIDDVSIH